MNDVLSKAKRLEQLTPERKAAIDAGYRRAEMFIRATQRPGVPMSYGTGKPPESEKS